MYKQENSDREQNGIGDIGEPTLSMIREVSGASHAVMTNRLVANRIEYADQIGVTEE
jgi:hypothetical protein